MAKPKHPQTDKFISEIKLLQIGDSRTFYKEIHGFNSLADLRNFLYKKVYTYLPSIQIICERVYETPAHIKLTRIR